jgi:hypothetical protein
MMVNNSTNINKNHLSPQLLTEGYMLPSPQLQQYLQSNEEEPYYILKTNNPVFFGFQTDTIPIISCHGYIRLPV